MDTILAILTIPILFISLSIEDKTSHDVPYVPEPKNR